MKGAETPGGPWCGQGTPLLETLRNSVSAFRPLHVSVSGHSSDPPYLVRVCAWPVLHEKELQGNSEAKAP